MDCISFKEKIRNLEHKNQLQSLKYEEIYLQLESLKAKQNHHTLLSSIVNSPLTKVSSSLIVDSKSDDSAPNHSQQLSTNFDEKLTRIVIAKYSYEPLRFSPNKHPEIELPLKLGEYYLIYDDVDEVINFVRILIK